MHLVINIFTFIEKKVLKNQKIAYGVSVSLLSILTFFIFPQVSQASTVIYTQEDISQDRASTDAFISIESTTVTFSQPIQDSDDVWGRFYIKMAGTPNASMQFIIGEGSALGTTCRTGTLGSTNAALLADHLYHYIDVQLTFLNHCTGTSYGFHLYQFQFAGLGYSGAAVFDVDLIYAIITSDGQYDPPLPDTTTHIVDFTPHAGDCFGYACPNSTSTAAYPVDFSLHVYVNPDDVGTFLQVRLFFEQVDQNVPLVPGFSPSSFVLVDEVASTTGDLYFSETHFVPTGNYLVRAEMVRSFGLYGIGVLQNPFDVFDSESHQYVVRKGTFIGTLTQNLVDDLNSIASSTNATTTQAAASSCNPLSGNFDIPTCGSFLFVPSPASLANTNKSFQNQLANRFPWGYITRFGVIVASTTAVEPISLSYTFGTSSPAVLQGLTYTINPFDAENMNKLASIRTDDGQGKNIWDIVNPYFQMVVNITILLMILADIIGFNYAIFKKEKEWSAYESESTTIGTDRNFKSYSSTQHTVGRRRKLDV